MTLSSQIKLAAAAIALSMATACVLPPKSDPQLQTIEEKNLGLSVTDAPTIEDHWWRQYADEQFEQLISSALDRNPSLQQALARVRVAQAQIESAAAGRGVEINLKGEEQRLRYPERFIYPPPFGGGTYWQGALLTNFSWDMDFWGRQSALIENARASAQAAALDSSAARLAITSSLVQAYLDLDRAYALADIAAQSAEQRRQILNITRKRIAAGLDTNVELREAEGAVPQAEFARLAAESARDLAIHRLAALTGHGGDIYQQIHRPTLKIETVLSIPSELPADLLGRRPDILAARARVEAAMAQRTAARAAFFPNINLSAFVGFQAIGLSNLFKPEDRTYGAGPAFSLPLFESKRLKSSLRAATAAEDEAIATYNDTIVKAVQQVADQLTLVRSSAQQLEQARAALTAAEDAYRLAQLRYQAGLANYLSVLATETQVLNARTTYVDVTHSQALARVALLLAMGGDFTRN